MAWESRKGRLYYYRKERRGDRVASVYGGSGAAGEAAARRDSAARAARVRAEEPTGRESNHLADEVKAVNSWYEDVEILARAALLATGHHQHSRGEWRKRRDFVQR